MKPDYDAIDEALDEEIRSMNPDYQIDATSTETTDSPAAADAGTESTPEIDSVDNTDTSIKETTDDTQEAVVPESRYRNAVVAMNKAQQELAEYRKNESQKDEYIQQLQQLLTEKQQQDTSTQEIDDDSLERAREIFPEVTNPLLKIISNLEKKLSLVTDDVGNVKSVANRFQQNEQKTASSKHFDDIKEHHADLDEIVASDEYADWYVHQAPMIQQALQQGTSRDVIAALNLYRADHPSSVHVKNSITKLDKLAQAKAAASPTINKGQKPEQKQTFTNEQIAKMSRAEFMKYEDAIDIAMANGEIY